MSFASHLTQNIVSTRNPRYRENIQKLLTKWANANYVPRKLNIIAKNAIHRHRRTLALLLQSCVLILRTKNLQKISDLEHTA